MKHRKFEDALDHELWLTIDEDELAAAAGAADTFIPGLGAWRKPRFPEATTDALGEESSSVGSPRRRGSATTHALGEEGMD